MTSQINDNDNRPVDRSEAIIPQNNPPQIQLQVLSVIKRNSPALPTTHYTYNDKGEPDPKMTIGAEWEEIEFTTIQEDKPVIQISNIIGSVFLLGNTIRLIINNPKLFGTYKMGDVINLMPPIVKD